MKVKDKISIFKVIWRWLNFRGIKPDFAHVGLSEFIEWIKMVGFRITLW